MSNSTPPLAKRLIAEFIGTLILVFMGTLAITSLQDAVGIGLAFAAAAIGAIYAFGHSSGAHINPAVTFGLAARGKFPIKEVIPYIAAQIIGAIVAAGLNAAIVGEYRWRMTLLGGTYPNQGLGFSNIFPGLAALIAEIITTFILVLTVLSVTEKEAPSGFAGIAIGFVLGINVMITAGISGGSMNPARSFGPALLLTLLGVPINTAFDYQWIYWVSPLLGAAIAAGVHVIKSGESGED
jgi:glycerol uptake facilitator protein